MNQTRLGSPRQLTTSSKEEEKSDSFGGPALLLLATPNLAISTGVTIAALGDIDLLPAMVFGGVANGLMGMAAINVDEKNKYLLPGFWMSTFLHTNLAFTSFWLWLATDACLPLLVPPFVLAFDTYFLHDKTKKRRFDESARRFFN